MQLCAPGICDLLWRRWAQFDSSEFVSVRADGSQSPSAGPRGMTNIRNLKARLKGAAEKVGLAPDKFRRGQSPDKVAMHLTAPFGFAQGRR